MGTCPIEGCSNRSTLGSPECIRHKFAGGMRINGLHTFKMAREGNYTQMELAADFRKDVVRRGRSEKVAYVGRERTPTDKWVNGRWEQVDAR